MHRPKPSKMRAALEAIIAAAQTVDHSHNAECERTPAYLLGKIQAKAEIALYGFNGVGDAESSGQSVANGRSRA